MKEKFYTYVQNLQNRICNSIETIDQKQKFNEDLWIRNEGGGGISRVLENGAVFEKAGVNISSIHGLLPKSMQEYFKVKALDFNACGISLVIHPNNPIVPTVHFNLRYFEMLDKKGKIIDHWFGGGQDLTPYYVFEEDIIHFHQICKDSCDKYGISLYEEFKKSCDSYFWNSHRNEARGIGGIFFDYLKFDSKYSMENWYSFVVDVGNNFLESYNPIVNKRKDAKYSSYQKNWQEIRRGRYVEFNLIHDKGTIFGLKTNGRIESILMSLPPRAQWLYNFKPLKNSEEEVLIKLLEKPKKWLK
jgi:coproporphyrinogen III oxidase